MGRNWDGSANGYNSIAVKFYAGESAAGYGNGTGTSTSVQVFEGEARDLKGHLLRGLAPVVTTMVMMPLYE